MTGTEQGVRMAVRCWDCGGSTVRSAGQFLVDGRELWWDAERCCPQCGVHLCEQFGPGPVPQDVREALLTAHGPARLRLTGPPASPVAALRAIREGSEASLSRARELLAELTGFGLSGTAVEMAYWRARLAERGVTAEVTVGFGRAYRYVGPPELREAGGPAGPPVRTADEFAAWADARTAEELTEPFTFVIDLGGALRLAPRRSEHVACAGGEPVLSAGEVGFRRSGGGWEVETVSNHSTGYCPEPTSWPAVTAALTRLGLPHPGAFTYAAVFRRCPGCGTTNLVREEHYVCASCDADVPARWNVDPTAEV
ncbi:hypothetical protein GCM10018790_16870 [Kitasatospora xanthocidica]|uniref:hypothetical protein n=1 Tax=Kitasatospora xanthocidica TaxID=83382 RepID=UPI0019CE98CB|nr:hypothetical protein [Kitasatospora xanthocidica]GHF39906.1 hypothetical protein GCM10018790_16870 [Kitasatospora xanthocidica]